MLLWQKIQRKFYCYDIRVWYLILAQVSNSLGFSVVLPFLSIYLYQDLQVPMSLVGLVFLFSAISRSFFQYVGGFLSDRWGRKHILLLGSLGRSLAFIFLGAAVYTRAGLFWFGLGIVISYIFGAIFFPAADAMVADIVRGEDRIEVYSLQRIGVNLGWAIGPAAGGFLTRLPFYLLFFITAGFFLATFIFILIYVRESWTGIKTVNSGRLLSFDFNKLSRFLWYCFFSLIIFSVINQIVSTLAVYSVHHVGITKIHLGFLFTLNGLMIVLLQFHASKLIRRFPLTRALTIGAILISSGFFIVPFAVGFVWLVISMALITLGEILVTPSGATLVSRWSPVNETGRYFGIYGLFMSFGMSIGPFYGGILMDGLSQRPFLLWDLIAIGGLIAACGFHWIGKVVPAAVNSGR